MQRHIRLAAALGALAIIAITANSVAADQPQPADPPGSPGTAGQMGPALRPGAVAGGTAPTTPQELQRRQDQLDRINRSAPRPQQPDAPTTPPPPGSQSGPAAQPTRVANCQLLPVFAPMLDAVTVVGDCLEDAYVQPSNGDLLQPTTGGLLVQRADDGSVAFTDGAQTWVLGSDGVIATVLDNA